MATLRKITLNWEIRTGAITCDTGYIKRQELCDVDLYVTVDGTAYALDTSWALNLSIKPALLGDNAALIAVTTWTASATTGLYQATAQTMGGTALDTYLAANNADTTDDEGNKLVDLDVYYTISTAVKSKSDTVTVILKPDVGRADDTVPATIIARNDFLVTNGTGLLVNVAAGYAANGAFVAAQASLAITNATNYIEVTAAGVASVNTTAFTAGSYPLATVVASAGAITANTDLRAWITPKPASAGGVTSITGTANEITVTGTTTPTLSLPSALTLTTKTVTGGTFTGGAFNGTVGATTPSTVAGTTGTFSGALTGGTVYVTGGFTLNGNVTPSASFPRLSGFGTFGAVGTGVKFTGDGYTGIGNKVTGAGAVSLLLFTNDTAQVELTHAGVLACGAVTATTLTASATTSLLLGTAGSAVGNVGFRNATSGTTTLAPAAGALGTGTVTLPLSGTLATLEGANTFTGANVNSTAGAASLPAMKFTGVPFAGTGTTSFPLVYINDANATASTTLNTAGTYFGVNGDGTQDLMNLLKDGVTQFKVGSTGVVKFTGGTLGSGGTAVTLAADNGSTTFLQYGSGGTVALNGYNNGCNLTFTANTTAAAFGNGTVSLQNLTASGTIAVTGASTQGGAAAAATTATRLTKLTSSIADNTATAVLTVTIPNAAHAASLRVRLLGRLGAGGAIGADEANGTVTYDFSISRTAGVNAVVTASTAFGSATSSVAGAATVTVTAAASAISGAVGASNTFTVNVTIAKGSGSSANHTCTVLAEVINANATGITIA